MEKLQAILPRFKALAGEAPSKVGFDEEYFQKLVDHGTKAWADVPNATNWTEVLRGNSDEEGDVSHGEDQG